MCASTHIFTSVPDVQNVLPEPLPAVPRASFGSFKVGPLVTEPRSSHPSTFLPRTSSRGRILPSRLFSFGLPSKKPSHSRSRSSTGDALSL